MGNIFFDIENDINLMMNYRYVQPPQIAYFVTTMDEFGNVNSTPATLGTCNSANQPRDGKPAEYFLTFSLVRKLLKDDGNYLPARDGFVNLQHSDEAVISYIPVNLMQESIVANLPFPRGISELEVAGLHTFRSRNIEVPSIEECPINIECKIINQMDLGETYMLYVAKVVGVSVNQSLVDIDNKGLGVFLIDPLFEINITRTKNGNSRLNYGQLDRNKISIPGDNFGSTGDWVGTFENFIKSEVGRGKITKSEHNQILDLKNQFVKDRSNRDVKNKLTQLLKKAVYGEKFQ